MPDLAVLILALLVPVLSAFQITARQILLLALRIQIARNLVAVDVGLIVICVG